MKKTRLLGGGVVMAGLMVIGGVATAALADVEVDSDDVEVTVAIEKRDVPGALALSVASNSTALTENGSTDVQRIFTGSLPTVTVTDTRDQSTVPDDAFWAVAGTLSSFTGSEGQPEIPATNFGWSPAIVNGGDTGLVAPGDEVVPEPEGGVGMDVGDLLFLGVDAKELNPEGQWSASAALRLVTEATVAPGNYSAVLTLSLFE